MIYNLLFYLEDVLKRIANLTIGKYLGFLLFIIPAPVYFFYLMYYSTNIPFLDDYDAILGFLVDFKNETDTIGKIKLVFAEHNDHRLGFLHIVSLLQFYLLGSINFKYLILFGNISILVMLLILWCSVKVEKHKFFYFTPVLYLLFGFAYFEASFWAMVSLSGLSVVAFSLASIFFLGKEKYGNFIWSCLFAIVAVFTQGNGKIVLFCGLFALLLNRDYLKAFVWATLSIALLLLPNLFFESSFQGYTPILEILQSPKAHILSIFSFLGTYFDRLHISIAIGVIIFMYFVYLILTKYYLSNLVLFTIMLFIILNAIAVGYARPSIEFPSRYAIYSTLSLVLIYLTLLDVKNFVFFRPAISFLGLIIITAQVYQYLTLPLKLDYYNITVKNYERHLVMNQYFSNKFNRSSVNKNLLIELNSIFKDPMVLDSRVDAFLFRASKNTNNVMNGTFWWLDHIEPFSNNLRSANSLGIYSIDIMLNQK